MPSGWRWAILVLTLALASGGQSSVSASRSYASEASRRLKVQEAEKEVGGLGERSLLLRKASQPLLVTNLQEAAISKSSSPQTWATTGDQVAVDDDHGGGVWEDVDDQIGQPADGSNASGQHSHQTWAGPAQKGSGPPQDVPGRGASTLSGSGSLSSRLIGGLRGHLFNQLRAKGKPLPHEDPTYTEAVLDLAKAPAANPPAVLEVYEEDMEDDGSLTSWWPMGSHLQPLVKPFVQQREIKQPGKVSKEKSGISDWASWLPGGGVRPAEIPKIFHQVYVEGEAALVAAEAAAEGTSERWPPVKAAWRQSCWRLHPDWEFKLWDLPAIEHLLETRYPWFLPTFHAYPQLIHKVDAARPFIMDTYGGVYIDVDTECLQPVDGFLEEHELVFQEEDFGTKSLVNSAIAGVPGHYFWHVWQQTILQRAPQLQRQRAWYSRADFDVIAVLNATGPWALRAAFQNFSRDYGLLHTSYIGSWRINDTNVMIYPLGTWFVPCLWNNVQCHELVEQLAAKHDIPLWLAGHHKNAGSWFKAAGFSRVGSRRANALGLLAAAAVVSAGLYLYCRRCAQRPFRRRRGGDSSSQLPLLVGRRLSAEPALEHED